MTSPKAVNSGQTEREALIDKLCGQLAAAVNFIPKGADFDRKEALSLVEQARASLTAEKVAGQEPVTSYCPSRFGKQPHAFNHQKCGYCGIAAPQQPAQSGEQSAAPKASAQATWETTAIANELWQIADQCGYAQFRDALSVHIKKAYQDGWQDHSNGVASVTYGEQK